MLSGAAGLAFDAPEAVVFEGQPELGVVGRAADVRALGGGREFDERDPGERHDQHREAGGEQLRDAPRASSRARRRGSRAAIAGTTR